MKNLIIQLCCGKIIFLTLPKVQNLGSFLLIPLLLRAPTSRDEAIHFSQEH
jgi:hypothetical protein